MEMNVTFPGGQRVNADFKGYSVETDQSVRGGGEGLAPAPFDYFLVSIGSCVGYYVMSFMSKRGMPTDDGSVRLRTEHDRERRMISKISMTIHVPESFPAKYQQAIINSANLCSVKKHIDQPPEFETVVEIGKPVTV